MGDNKVPIYENNDNQKPLFFIKVPKKRGGKEFSWYKYNYNCCAEGGKEKEEYIKLNKKEEDKMFEFQPVEAFTYCKYQYNEDEKTATAVKNAVTADYDMLFAISQKISPLELNSADQIVEELKYFQLKAAMGIVRFTTSLRNIAKNCEISFEDKEFLIEMIKELKLTSSGQNQERLEDLEGILKIKFAVDQKKLVKNFIGRKIKDLKLKIIRFDKEINQLHELDKEIYDQLNKQIEDGGVDYEEYIEIAKKVLKRKDVEEVVRSLLQYRKLKIAIEDLEEVQNLDSLEEIKEKIQKESKYSTIKKYISIVEEDEKQNIDKDETLSKIIDFLEKDNMDVIYNSRLEVLERLYEKLSKNKLEKFEENILRVVVSELLKEHNNLECDLGSKEINTENLRKIVSILHSENQNRVSLDKLQELIENLFSGKFISVNEQEIISEHIFKLEKHRRMEIIQSEADDHENSSGLTTIYDRVFLAVLKSDTDENINHGPEYANTSPEPISYGNYSFLLPKGEVRIVKTERHLCTLINELRKDGYPVPINQKWGWICDKGGNLCIPERKFNFGIVENAIKENSNDYEKKIKIVSEKDLSAKRKQRNSFCKLEMVDTYIGDVKNNRAVSFYEILQKQSELYALYLHICDVETSPKMIYGKMENYLRSYKDLDRVKNINVEILEKIQKEVQKRFDDEDEQDISKLNNSLIKRWDEYCSLKKYCNNFKESDFDGEFENLMKNINIRTEYSDSTAPKTTVQTNNENNISICHAGSMRESTLQLF